MIREYILGDYVLKNFPIGNWLIPNANIGVQSETPFPKDRIIVGVMGSGGKDPDLSGQEYEPSTEERGLGELVGRIIADENCIASNGALYGFPYFTVRGAKNSGGYREL